jgi:YVTN family beta-propeller protein
VGRAPFGIAGDDRGLWVALLGDGVVARIDPATARVTQRIQTGGDPVAVAADGRHVWVALNGDHALLRLDR